jgi:FMN phosphatase YigB (HAD superfamily)
LRVIIDFDGTLTAEEQQARALAEKSLRTLAKEIVHVPQKELVEAYDATQARLLEAPHRYWWEVNGLIASYCDEGAFILNTTTLQFMLRENDIYAKAVASAFPEAEYGPVVDCTNYLFHRHTAELEPVFRPAARQVLDTLAKQPNRAPVILTNSLGDKVRRHLATLDLKDEVHVLGDTRQYEMDPNWDRRFSHPDQGDIQMWRLSAKRRVDLRRPAYYHALVEALEKDPEIVVAADTFSLPGALPLIMGLHFLLVRTRYTPDWCVRAAGAHPNGAVLDELGQLPDKLDEIGQMID